MPDLSLMAIARKVGKSGLAVGPGGKLRVSCVQTSPDSHTPLDGGASDALSDSIELTLELTRAKVLSFFS